MAFIDTIPAAAAQGAVREMYERQQAHWGYVPNYAKVFSRRPEVLARWGRLLAEIRRPMDDRRFELATFAAAIELRNTACALAHGKALARFTGTRAVLDLAAGKGTEALTEAEVAVAAFARKVARDAAAITEDDVAELRSHGLDDTEIFDVVAAAAGRAFFTKMLDGLGVLADSGIGKLDRALREALIVGRPVSEEAPEYLGQGR
jgi:uncharacterized peroxidase-related enzyme